MKSFKWRRFSDPEFLGGIAPALLSKLLEPFSEFFISQGASIASDAIDYSALIGVFTDPSAGIPEELLETLFYLDEVSIDTYHEDLAVALSDAGGDDGIPDDLSTADLAVRLWLIDRRAVERLHAEQYLTRYTKFESYVTRARDIPKHRNLTPDLEAVMTTELENRLRPLKQGGAVRVYGFDRTGDICFVVRFGGLYQRDLRVEGDEPTAIAYRPVKHGVMIYYPKVGELGVHADGRRVTRAFVDTAGLCLLGSELAFAPADAPGKYSLQPLLDKGSAALDCSTNDNLENAALAELRFRYRSGRPLTACYSGDDVLAAFDALSMHIPHGVLLVSAELRYQASRSIKPRKVRVRPPNVVSYERESDAEFIEPWLLANGFINDRFKAVGIGEESFWTAFDRRHGLIAARGEWIDEFGSLFPQLDPLLVTNNENLESVIVNPVDDTAPAQRRRVVMHPDGSRVAVENEPGGDRTPVTKVETAALRLEVALLAERLADMLGLEASFEVIGGLKDAWQLGVYRPVAGVRSSCVLLKPDDAPHFGTLLDGLVSRSMTPCMVMVPTRRVVSGDLAAQAVRQKIVVVVLDEITTPEPEGWFQFNHEWPELIEQLRQLAVPSSEVQSIRFMTPPDSTWGDVRMQFRDFACNELSIKVKKVTGIFTPVEMGMADRRSKKPDRQWEFLRSLADEPHGILTWDSSGADRKNRAYRDKLSKRLREFFGLEDDPIPYDAKEAGWRWKFTIRPYDWVE